MSDTTYITKEQLANVVSHLQAQNDSLRAELANARIELEKQAMFQDARGWVLWQMLDKICEGEKLPTKDELRSMARSLAEDYEKLQLDQVRRASKPAATAPSPFEVETHG